MAVTILAVSCGASDTVDLQNFAGAPWETVVTGYTDCIGGALGVTNTLLFTATPTGLTSVAASGCTFDFTVNGDVATLSNSPVACQSGEGATEVIYTYSRVVATSSDGHHLTVELSGTFATTDVMTCPLEETVVGTR